MVLISVSSFFSSSLFSSSLISSLFSSLFSSPSVKSDFDVLLTLTDESFKAFNVEFDNFFCNLLVLCSISSLRFSKAFCFSSFSFSFSSLLISVTCYLNII